LIGPEFKGKKKFYTPTQTARISVQKGMGAGWWASRRAMFKVKQAVKTMGGKVSEVRFARGADYLYLDA
jgi:hypothetical protein